ncbi:MAG: pilus assembly protein [Hyphomicrobiales bacterium]|nr:pilus assembly protein [Hyphomicrobiales bacterium]
MNQRPHGRLRYFAADTQGAVAVLFVFMSVTLLGLVGAAVDFTMYNMKKAKMQAMVDQAALEIAATYKTTNAAQRAQIAQTRIRGAFPTADVSETETSATFSVSAQATMPTNLIKFIGVYTVTVAAQATAAPAQSNDTWEIALALDNTGSMSSVIGNLRQAATNFVNVVYNAGAPNVKMSVVPYVAAVNPGLTDMTHVDMQAQSVFNGSWFSGSWAAYNTGCVQNWNSGSPPPPPGTSSSGDSSGDASRLQDILNPFRRFAREMFGFAPAYAADITPNTIPPLSTNAAGPDPNGKSFQVPVGFQSLMTAGNINFGMCDWLVNPSLISHYDLFKRVKNNGAAVAWKGCVEARPSAVEISSAGRGGAQDYDVTDAPPVLGAPDSLFVPYFWPDEPDRNPSTWAAVAPGPYASAVGGFHNNYLADATIDPGFGWTIDTWSPGQQILNYNGANAAIIKESYPDTYGPNAGCPDAVMRLSSNAAAVRSKIGALGYWYNGGTVISEGLMWAWRSLSPNAPYADGKPYAASNPPAGSAVNHKVIVLMTDGVNGLASNGDGNSTNKSDYSAYGYLGSWRLSGPNNLQTFDQASAFFDKRTLAACANAKAAGVTIYTLLFNHSMTAAQANNSANLLTQCASSPSNFFQATDAASLNAAFNNIAGAINHTRLLR